MDNYQATMRPAYAVDEAQSALLRSVFGWMALGLLTTALVSGYIIGNQALLFKAMDWIFPLIIMELGLVWWLSARIMKMAPAKATGIFLAYSALNGITLAPLAYAYTEQSITTAFVSSAGMFGAMALYGYVTKKDLSGMGSFLMMGLFGLIIASIVSIFWHSTMLNFIINVAGILIFAGLTAYDVQKIKRIGAEVSSGTDSYRRYAIIGALRLYLDFINMFLFMLRLFGDRR